MSDEWEDVPAAGSSADDGWADVKPEKRGLLDRQEGDGWLTGAVKGGATAAIQGVSDIPGAAGNVREMNKMLSDRALLPVGVGAVNLGRWALGYDPVDIDKVRENIKKGNEMLGPGAVDKLPTGDDIAKPYLEKTGKYEPESTAGKMAQTAARAVIGSPGAVVPAKTGLLKQSTEDAGKILKEMYRPGMAATTAGAAATGEAVTDLTQDPYYGFAASMLAPAAASKAGKFALHAGAPVLEDIPGVNKWAQGTRERMAAEDILRTTKKPEQIMSWANNGQIPEGLDKFPMTLGQATGNSGVLTREHELRTGNRQFADDMMDLQGRQTEALHGAVEAATPKNADPLAVTDAFQQRFNRVTQRYEQAEQALRQRAQEAVAALGSSQGAEAVGEQLRTAIADNQKKMNEEIKELYSKVNPNKDMRVIIDVGTENAPSVREVAEQIHGDKKLATKFTPGLAETIQILRDSPSVMDFEELRAVDERLTQEMDEARMSGDNTNYGRLSQLKSAVKNTINQAVDNQIGWERANNIPPEHSLEGRLGSSHEGFAATGNASPSAGEGVAKTGTDASASMAVHPTSGEGRPAEFGFGDADRGAGLAEKAGENKLYYPGGNHITARPKIVELDDLHISHHDDFSENPNYPQELQPRDRDVAQAQEQVNKYAGSEWAPDRYGITNDANSGAPVIGPDGVVESGNGRSMAIRRRYDQGDTSYKEHLASQGHDVSGFKKPVLVMERTTEFSSPEARQQYTHLVNRESGLGLGTKEQASSDSRFLTPEDIYKLKEGPLHSEANANFVRAYLGRLTSGDRARLVDAKGIPNQRGLDRAQAAVVQRAYEHDAVLRRGFESLDNNAKNLTGALTDAAGPWAKMRQAIEDGRIDKSHDITPELMNGVDKILRARDEGRPVGEILDQIDAFGSPVTKDVYALLLDGNKVASRQKIAARLNKYAKDAIGNETDGFGFGEVVDPKKILSDAQTAVVEGEEAAAVAPKVTPKTGDALITPDRSRPNIEPGQAEALKSANAKFGEMKDTMRPAEKMLEKRMGGQYEQMGSTIPATVIKPGDAGYQTAQSFLKAAANKPEAATAMREMILDRFRKAVSRDGSVNPNQWSNLQRDYAGSIRAIEEVSPGLAKMLKTPETTADALAKFGQEKKANIDALQKEEAAKFLGKENEVEVQNAVANMINGRNPSVTKIRNMVETLKSENPAALEGLQKATIDWIVRKDTNATKTVNDQDVFSYAKINNLLKDKSHLLAEILTPEQMNTLRAMRDSMAVMNRSSDRTKISGTSNSAKDWKSHFNEIGSQIAEKSFYAVLVDAWMRGEGLADKALKTAGIGAIGAAFKWRQLGMNSISDLQRDMLLNPEVARMALKKVKPEFLPKQGEGLSKAIRRGYLNAGADVEREKRAAGGRLGFAAGGQAPKRKAMTPDQIISGIEKARKAEQKRTEVILDKPDETVVRALSMANQHL